MNRIVCGDCIKIMDQLEPGSVDLVFADPPFNIAMGYDVYQDNISVTAYEGWTEDWLMRATVTLKDTGTLWVAIGDEFAGDMLRCITSRGLYLRRWVIWYYTFGVNCVNNFTRSHTHLLYFTRDPKRFTFNADAIRVPSARQKVYRDRRARPGGRLPDDTWILRPQEVPEAFGSDGDTWFVSRVCGTFKERRKHPCQMPERVLERIILACSNPGDLVLDPFVGSGTTCAVARRLGRRWLGIELSPEYAKAAQQRCEEVVDAV